MTVRQEETKGDKQCRKKYIYNTSESIFVSCCMRDEGRPLGAALQEEASNHHKLRWSKARVVSVMEKAELDFVRYV